PRNEPEHWGAVPLREKVRLAWQDGKDSGALVLEPAADGSAVCHGCLSRGEAEARLRQPGHKVKFDEIERRVAVTLDGQRQEIVFATPARRQLDLRTTADWVLRPRLRKIPGVASVTVMGGGRKQYQVLADPRALLEAGVTL